MITLVIGFRRCRSDLLRHDFCLPHKRVELFFFTKHYCVVAPYSLSLTQTAQHIRASLLATAQVALLCPTRPDNSNAQICSDVRGSPFFLFLLALSSTDLPPCTNKVRKYVLPCLFMPPSDRVLPELCTRGVSPTQLANFLPVENRAAFPTLDTSAVLVNNPIPGTRCNLCITSSCRVNWCNSRSISFILNSSVDNSSIKPASVDLITGGIPSLSSTAMVSWRTLDAPIEINTPNSRSIPLI